MRGLSILCFFLILPILAVLGHDIYATYQGGDYTQTMMFSNIRYLFMNYAPDIYIWVERNADQALWDNYLTPIMDTKSVIIAAIPAGIALTLLLVLRLFSLLSLSGKMKTGQKKGNFSFGSGERDKGKMTYKRK